jgi:hypothetical protein
LAAYDFVHYWSNTGEAFYIPVPHPEDPRAEAYVKVKVSSDDPVILSSNIELPVFPCGTQEEVDEAISRGESTFYVVQQGYQVGVYDQWLHVKNVVQRTTDLQSLKNCTYASAVKFCQRLAMKGSLTILPCIVQPSS